MRGGHNRLPAAVHEARGTDQPCRMNADEPRLAAIPVPPPPDEMGGEQRKQWLRLAPQVDALGTFTAADHSAYELMVEIVAFAKVIARDSEASANQKIQARSAAARALAEFGLSPQARTRVKALPKAETEDDPVGEFVQ